MTAIKFELRTVIRCVPWAFRCTDTTVDEASNIVINQAWATMLHFFRVPGPESEDKVLQAIRDKVPSVTRVQTEACFNVEVLHAGQQLSELERGKLLWLFTETFEPESTRSDASYLSIAPGAASYSAIVEVGPRMAFSTAWSSNCASMCQACGIASVGRIERSRRYLIATSGPAVPLTPADVAAFATLVHDRMTECVYAAPLQSFANGALPTPVAVIPVLSEVRGRDRERGESKRARLDLGTAPNRRLSRRTDRCRFPSRCVNRPACAAPSWPLTQAFQLYISTARLNVMRTAN